MANYDLFKAAVGADSDLIGYAEFKNEEVEHWKDEMTISFGNDCYFTGSLYLEFLKTVWVEFWIHASALSLRPFYFKSVYPNYDAYDNYDLEDTGSNEDLLTCYGFYTDVDFLPIHAYTKGNFGSCMVAFVNKIWHREDPLKIHCGFDSGTEMSSRDFLVFRGWKGTWTIWETCDWSTIL